MRSNTKLKLQSGGFRSIRDLEVDRFRGALLVLMVGGDYLAGINWIPSFLKHAPDIGFTVADAVAPAFVFVIGLNYGPSFARRLQLNRFAAYRHFVLRYLSLIGIGAIITAGSALVDRSTGWGVLESLGIAGLITLIFIRLPTSARFLVGILILAVYQYFLDTAMLESVLSSGHGGFFGAISWSALLILSTALSDIWRRGMTPYVLSSVCISLMATVSVLLIPVSKNRVSLSYILLTLALSALAFLLIKTSSRATAQKKGVLCWWGQNALTIYLSHLLLLAPIGLPEVDWWYVDVPVWLMLLQLTCILTLLSILAKRLSGVRALGKN